MVIDKTQPVLAAIDQDIRTDLIDHPDDPGAVGEDSLLRSLTEFYQSLTSSLLLPPLKQHLKKYELLLVQDWDLDKFHFLYLVKHHLIPCQHIVLR